MGSTSSPGSQFSYGRTPESAFSHPSTDQSTYLTQWTQSNHGPNEIEHQVRGPNAIAQQLHGTRGMSYSNLEVSPNQYECSLPEAVGAQIQHHQYLANRYDLESQKHSIPSVSSPTVRKDYVQQSYGQQPAAPPPQQEHGNDKRRCGLAPVTFWVLLAAVILIVIGAVLGAVLGTQLNKSSGAPEEAPVGGDTVVNWLNGSRLSAASWQDASGAGRRAIFYQTGGQLYRSSQNPDDSSWSKISISAQFDPPLSIRNGTPIAVTTTPPSHSSFSAQLYFLDSGGRVRELISTDVDLSSWEKGSLWDVARTASGVSDLAAVGYYCGECFNASVVIYQATTGGLLEINGQNWAAQPTYLVTASTGSSLAMVQVPSVQDGKADFGNKTWIKLLYSRDGRIDEYNYNQQRPGVWVNGPIGIIQNFTSTSADFLPRVAVAPSVSNGLALAVGITGDGTAQAAKLNTNGEWAAPDSGSGVTFFDQGGTAKKSTPDLKLTSVAMDSDFSLYGLARTGKRVTQWSWGNANPFDFVWTSIPLQV